LILCTSAYLQIYLSYFPENTRQLSFLALERRGSFRLEQI